MVKYSQGEIRQIARRFGTSPGVVKRMAQAQVLDKTQALNGNGIPEGLITLGDAARECGIPLHRLHNWVTRGHLAVRGRQPGPGGAHILIAKTELAEFLLSPPKTGRPRKRTD